MIRTTRLGLTGLALGTLTLGLGATPLSAASLDATAPAAASVGDHASRQHADHQQRASASRGGCHRPVAASREHKDPHTFTAAEVDSKERSFKSSMKSSLGTISVAKAARIGAADGPIDITVQVHVVGDGTRATEVSDAVINRQMRVLNSAYSGTPFRFALGDVVDISNEHLAHDVRPDSREERGLKDDRVGDATTLNLWITGLGSYKGDPLFGWATFPADYRSARAMDGVVVDRRTLPGQPGGYSQYGTDEGDTTTHEVGHWLGLYHTFEGGCEGGDEVADTPAQADPSVGCPEGKDTCEAPGVDPVHNYMDYSSDRCMTTFTRGQRERMVAQWSTYRG